MAAQLERKRGQNGEISIKTLENGWKTVYAYWLSASRFPLCLSAAYKPVSNAFIVIPPTFNGFRSKNALPKQPLIHTE
jgi:hypothetical protein